MGDLKNTQNPQLETNLNEAPAASETTNAKSIAPDVFLRNMQASDTPEDLVNGFIDSLDQTLFDTPEEVNKIMTTFLGALAPKPAADAIKFTNTIDVSDVTSLA